MMGLLALSVFLLFAPLLITRAGALFIAIAAGWMAHASSATIGASVLAAVTTNLAAGLALIAMTEQRGVIGRA